MGRQEDATPAAEDTSAAEQLQAIQGGLPLEIAGRAITIREYGFFEGLEVASRASALIDDMKALGSQGALRYAAIRRLFGKHHLMVVSIAAQSAGVEPAWIESLGDEDKDTFLSTWFGVHSSFFINEVIAEIREDALQAAIASTGTPSSPASPGLASATSNGSGGSQNGS